MESLKITHCSNFGKSVHFLVSEWNQIEKSRKIIWTDCSLKHVARTADAFKEETDFPQTV